MATNNDETTVRGRNDSKVPQRKWRIQWNACLLGLETCTCGEYRQTAGINTQIKCITQILPANTGKHFSNFCPGVRKLELLTIVVGMFYTVMLNEPVLVDLLEMRHDAAVRNLRIQNCISELTVYKLFPPSFPMFILLQNWDTSTMT